ncbi:deoxyribose-phosphate aldolase [Floccifex sp.]|uniref:deoxyribose-phosphate aldolase n=1 Tax=Floccifex sp. TaxID=2815810 RepID=UPI002A750902|nr:deoxyribose-phosphate aldolase [Floccifex sp.]MDD7282201.1 deoxyribose-phosphate aldolase [Erysipelotrichaceae bacterium]MDY2958430.1 deoxyribose-phosphate aldolase [Floccifex sp.]
MKRSKYIDHTLLKPESTREQIKKLCEEAIEYDFASVCVNPYWVSYCAELLKDSDVMVCTVIGFPLGANTSAVKAFETKDAIANGADEVDMVINIGELKAGNDEVVLNDIKAVVEASGDKTVKVIIETCLLTDEEITRVSKLCVEAKADFVKTSTGFNSAGANVHVVEVMKKAVGDQALIKAAGGVRTPQDMDDMIAAGANRIGTSKGISLM